MYGNGYRISPDEVIRGSAANLWRDGADGLYLFNWFNYGRWRSHLLQEIADPSVLRKKDKLYTLTQRFDSAPFLVVTYGVRYNTALKDAALPVYLTRGDETTLWLPVEEAPVTDGQAQLWIGLHHTQPGDLLSLYWNEELLHAELDVAAHVRTAGSRLEVPPGNGLLGFAPGEAYDMHFPALSISLDSSHLRAGRNRLVSV